MKRIGAIALVVTAILLIFFLVPIQGETIPDGCVGCYAHYDRSISCNIVPVGVSYWESGLNDLMPGCSGPNIP